MAAGYPGGEPKKSVGGPETVWSWDREGKNAKLGVSNLYEDAPKSQQQVTTATEKEVPHIQTVTLTSASSDALI